MLNKEMTKSEVENELRGKGVFVQIDHLNRFLKEPIGIDMKKFVFLKLASLYEAGKLFSETARMYENAAGVSMAFTEKIKNYMKAVEFYVRLGVFDRVELTVKKAMAEANSKEREDIRVSLKRLLKDQAETLEKEMKRTQAVRFYEKLSEMRLSDQERREVKEKLLNLYRRLGRLHEALTIEKSLKGD